MQTYILNIGNELLIGDTVNTNASWLGDFFYQRGLNIVEVNSISDDEEVILEGIERALQKADLVLITGGLGPTHDDITKKTLSHYFDCGMKRDEKVLLHVRSIFEKRGIKMQDINVMQADIPEHAEVLFNDLGTAPGLWFRVSPTQVLVSMPGVPYEMKFLVKERLWPKLSAEFGLKTSIRRTYFRTAGIGESNLSQEYLPEIPRFLERNDQLSLAFLPSAGEVKLRLTSTAENPSLAETQAKALETYIQEQASSFIYSNDRDEELPEAVGRELKDKKMTIATAESCTGGAIASAMTDIAGSTEYFLGSVVAYDNIVKKRVLGVEQSILEEHGAVSKEVALHMAKAVAELCGADIGVATTGVAGPSGGTDEKPVGLVWFGVWTQNDHFALKAYISKDRLINKIRSVKIALETVRRVVCEIEEMPFELSKQRLDG